MNSQQRLYEWSENWYLGKGVVIMSEKRLYKSNERKICGVCGGIAEYLGIDPFIVRLIWGILAFAWGTSIWIYILLVFIMSDRPDYVPDDEENHQVKKEAPRNIEQHEYIDAEPVGFRLNNGEKEEMYR
jgi:phage shock protein PspC (stress-responsive transcriptional regulator)